MPHTNEQTNCYTYKIEMIVQVLALTEPEALKILDEKGGHLTYRETTLLDSVLLLSDIV